MESSTDEPAPARLENCDQLELPNPAKWKLQGHSRAGERTGFWVHPVKLVLDAGLSTYRNPNAVFITHSHVDHSWMLPWIYGCRTPKLKGKDCAELTGRPVYAPWSAWPMLQQLNQACVNLSHGKMGAETMGAGINAAQGVHAFLCRAARSPGEFGETVACPCDPKSANQLPGPESKHGGEEEGAEAAAGGAPPAGVAAADAPPPPPPQPGANEATEHPNTAAATDQSKDGDGSGDGSDSSSSNGWHDVPGPGGLKVEFLPCYHSTETVGFGFATTTRKLREEFRGLSGKEIGALRRSGVAVTEAVVVPQLAFFGDTNTDALTRHSEWAKYPVVVIECTVYPGMGKTVEGVHRIGHVHWEALAPVIRSHPDVFFVCIHHSMAMKVEQLRRFQQSVREDSENGFQNFALFLG